VVVPFFGDDGTGRLCTLFRELFLEQYLPDRQGARDQLIALFQKGPVPRKAGVESLEGPITGVASPA
jgi:hypothetical protein